MNNQPFCSFVGQYTNRAMNPTSGHQMNASFASQQQTMSTQQQGGINPMMSSQQQQQLHMQQQQQQQQQGNTMMSQSSLAQHLTRPPMQQSNMTSNAQQLSMGMYSIHMSFMSFTTVGTTLGRTIGKHIIHTRTDTIKYTTQQKQMQFCMRSIIENKIGDN